MALALVRRLNRFSWLRLLLTLAIYALAVPGTVRSPAFARANAAAPAPAAAADADADEALPNIPANAKPQAAAERAFANDEVRILYCSTCGFQQNFAEVKQFLEERYPQLVDRVSGANYGVDPMRTLLARTLGYLQLVAMVLMVAGEYIFRALGLDTALLQKALDNRIGCFALILLVGSVSQGLVSTGAFEVILNGELVFSKLAAGRWMTLEELSEIFDARGLNALAT
ncbi:hypothetical protein PybrP1_001953 [[Pythium] brassicae (nom. inval.)]|nr:hypothetical protein PybrP1_001953 [[Pythium] brassicae (nom. inval.)]